MKRAFLDAPRGAVSRMPVIPAARSRRRAGLATAAILASLAAISSPALAEETARKTNDVLGSVADIARNLELADVPEPIDITADRLEFRYGQGSLRYDGNVNVEHAGAKIHADSLEVSFEPEGRRSLKKITARGGVEVTSGKESARGELAEYDPVAGTVVLSQNARLGSGPNSLSGEKVVVYLGEKRAVVLGGAAPAAASAPGAPKPAGTAPSGRIKAVILPDSIDDSIGGRNGDKR